MFVGVGVGVFVLVGVGVGVGHGWVLKHNAQLPLVVFNRYIVAVG